MGKSKPWPDEKPVNFRELVGPVCDAVRFSYDLSRRNEHRSIPWTGHNIGSEELVCSSPPHERLKRSELQYNEKEQGRDALEVLVGIAVQLGIEQGRRMERKRSSDKHDLAVILAKEVLRAGDPKEK